MRRSTHRLSTPVVARRWGGAMMMSAIYLTLLVMVVSSELLPAGSSAFYVLASLTMGAILVVALTPGRVTVGADGIAISRVGQTTFTPHHAVRATRVDTSSLARHHQRLVITTDDGDVVLPFSSQREAYSFVRSFRPFFKRSRRQARRPLARTNDAQWSYRAAPNQKRDVSVLRDVNAEPRARAEAARRCSVISKPELAHLAATTAHPVLSEVFHTLSARAQHSHPEPQSIAAHCLHR